MQSKLYNARKLSTLPPFLNSKYRIWQLPTESRCLCWVTYKEELFCFPFGGKLNLHFLSESILNFSALIPSFLDFSSLTVTDDTLGIWLL